MKPKAYARLALTAVVASCTTVYAIAPPPDPQGSVVTGGEQPAPPPDPPVEADEELPPRVALPLRLDARVGRSKLRRQGARRNHLLLEVRGRSGAGGTPRSTATALVIDASGSMKGRRIADALSSARGWIQRAAGGDQLSLLTFNQAAHLLAPLTVMHEGARTRLQTDLLGVVAGGATCLSCGIGQARDQLSRLDEAGVRRMVVLSDGQATHGITSQAGLRALARNCRRDGVAVSTIGVGLSYNEEVLAGLVIESNGLHHFVADSADLAVVFDRESGLVRSTVAHGTAVDIELSTGVELIRVFDRAFEQRDDRTVRVPLGTISRGEVKTVLLEVELPDQIGSHTLARVSLSFQEADKGQLHTISHESGAQIHEGPSSPLDPVVAMRLERSRTAAVIERATRLFQSGQGRSALRHLDRSRRTLRETARHASARAARMGDRRAPAIEANFERQIRDLDSARRGFSVARPKSAAARKVVRKMRVRRFELGF